MRTIIKLVALSICVLSCAYLENPSNREHIMSKEIKSILPDMHESLIKMEAKLNAKIEECGKRLFVIDNSIQKSIERTEQLKKVLQDVTGQKTDHNIALDDLRALILSTKESEND